MKAIGASYRDPSGYIYKENGTFYRCILPPYFEDYHAIKKAGIYEQLFNKGWLLSHEEISVTPQAIILQPEQLPFITYPYEWSADQYRHAAQLTLRLQLFLLDKGFSLKDATAFNITFFKGKAVFIDTLSITPYEENTPWIAHQQFVEHFFSVLVLTKYYGSYHLKTLQSSINGLDIKQAAQLLPWYSKLNPTVFSNIHLLAKLTQSDKSNTDNQSNEVKLSKASQKKMLIALENYIADIKFKEQTEWDHYYDQINYDDNSFTAKKEIITNWVALNNPESIWDCGGNDGTMSLELANNKTQVVVSDIDAPAINSGYLKNYGTTKNLTFLINDIAQPAPAIGLNNAERDSFLSRIKNYNPDLTMALAIIHHLTLTASIPFERSAALFASISPYLIIEFPDREDSWVQFILESKREARDLYDFYNKAEFLKVYSNYFTVIEQVALKNTHRTLFLLKTI